MNSIKMAWRNLFRKGEHSLTRIFSLAAGLSFGILLFSEVFYYYSYDNFYPDNDRIYAVCENFKSDKSSEKIDTYSRVSGAIGPGLKANIPGIEVASRLNSIGSSVFYTDDKKSYKAEFSLADEYVFDVLPRPVIYGNPKEILTSPMKCMISDKIAGMIGGDVIGKIIDLKEYPGKILTIAGIFKELPENTNYKYDVLISMASTPIFFKFDGRDNWLGNDRYYVCVKLAKGVDPVSLGPAVRKMQESNQDIVRLEKIQNGMVLKYSFLPLNKLHIDQVKDMIIILSVIALAVLIVSLLNYVLLTLNSLVSRARISAVYKTYGAHHGDLQRIIFLETSLLFVISLGTAYMIVTTVQPMIEAQIGHRLSSVMNPGVIRPLLIMMLVILLFISYLPGRFFARIPVTLVFHNYHHKGRKWKLALLSVQFAGASFILTFLAVVILQYDKLVNADHGYSAENVYLSSSSGMTGSKLPTVLNELRAMPQVKAVGLGYCMPTEGASGNNIRLPGERKELFNVADFYWIDDNYLSILNIPLTEGTGFSKETSIQNDFIISRKGADMLLLNTGWKDGVTGKEIDLTEHGTSMIRGIFPDFVIHSLSDADQRPAVFSYMPESKFQEMIVRNPSATFYILVKTLEGTNNDIMNKLTDIFNTAMPHRDAVVKSLEQEKVQLYASQQGFRTAMLTGSVVILLITLLGLLGYTVTEAARRRKELAIRKINGARLSDILTLFIKDLVYVAVPAVVAGLAGAMLVAQQWMESFALKTSLHMGLFVLCGLLIIIFVAVVSALNYIITANRNPVEALRYE